MKKILLVGLISSVFSAGAFAAACTATAATAGTVPTAVNSSAAAGEMCVCEGSTAASVPVSGGAGAAIGTPRFLKTGFDAKCSSNVILSVNEVSGTAFAVASGSRKGDQTFIGSTAGGSITADLACTGVNKACGGNDVTAANGRATTAAGS